MNIDVIKEKATHSRELRNFGLVFGTVFLIFAVLFWYHQKSYYINVGIVSLLFIFIALIVPKVLKPLYIVWMIFGLFLGGIMTRIILTTVFFLVLTPIALFMKLRGKVFFPMRPDKNLKSYWVKRETNMNNPDRAKKQF